MPADPTPVPLADRVAVVLLTHDCAHRLDTVLDRVLSLGARVIAVDNASQDDTVAVLERRPGVEVLALPHNIGAAARNVGLEQAAVPYVAFCDDDGWYEPGSLERAADALDAHPRLAVVNARITVGPGYEPDPISIEMADSPLPDEAGIPGAVLLGFMAGAVVVRRTAYLEVGGYDARFFLGGEEETLAMKLARAGWQLRYLPDVVMHHEPSIASAPFLRPYGLRNTVWNAWLHRRTGSALRYTAWVLADTPKNGDWVRGVAMMLRGLPWVVRHRDPMDAGLDAQYRVLEQRRFASRRPFWSTQDSLRAHRHGSGASIRPGAPRIGAASGARRR